MEQPAPLPVMPPTLAVSGTPGSPSRMPAGQVVGNTVLAFFVAVAVAVVIGVLVAVAVGALLIPGSEGWDGLGYAFLAAAIGLLVTVGAYVIVSIVTARRRIPAGQRALPITALLIGPVAIPIGVRLFVFEIWPLILDFSPF